MDREIARLAARQHGVVARGQIAALGMTETVIRNRMRRGLLLRIHRGVYALGHRRLRREGYWLAAVLAVGEGAALSHRDAAALHDLRASNGTRVDVTTTRRGRSSTAKIVVHRTTVLDPLDVTEVDGIPVTAVARTLVDLGGVVPGSQLAKAFGVAERLGTLDVRAIHAALERTRTRRGRGHAAMRAVLAEHRDGGAQLTRSALEDAFVALVAAHRLPRPRLNAIVAGTEVDAYWPESRVVVELDGYAFHRGRRAFQQDRTKGNALVAAGFFVLRYTHDDVLRRPAKVAAELAPLVAVPHVSPHGDPPGPRTGRRPTAAGSGA